MESAALSHKRQGASLGGFPAGVALRPRIVQSIGAQAIGAGLSALTSFALLLFLAREMGAAGFGDYAAVLSLASILLIAIEGGWPTLIYRESVQVRSSASPATRLAEMALGHMLLLGSGLALLAAALAMPVLAAALLCMALVATMNLVSSRLRGEGRFARESAWQVSGRVISAALIVAGVLWLGPDAATVFLSWAGGLALAIALCGRAWLPRPRWPGANAGYAIALPFVVIEGLNAAMFKGDVAMLKALGLPAAELSQYAACTRLTEAALLLFAPVTNVLLHSLRERVGDRAAFAATLKRALAAAASLGLLAWMGSWATSERLMAALFGPEFGPAGMLLPWVALSLPFSLSNLVCFQALIARDHERWLLLALILSATTLALGLSIGALASGARGAAQGVAVAQALLLGACWLGLRRHDGAS